MGHTLWMTLTVTLICAGEVWAREPGELYEELVERVRPSAARQFLKAWTLARSGNAQIEVVVMMVKAEDGRYDAAVQPLSNQFHKATAEFHTGVVAIFHTHPNSVQAEPSAADRRLADRLGIPIATMTAEGFFLYDPVTRMTRKVMEGLGWLKEANWGSKR